IITHWIKNKDYPSVFSIEKTGVLQDPNQQNRVIRCQQQDLFSNSILSLIKDGCEVKQLAMNWQDRVNFVLSDDFTLKSIKFQDEIKQQSQEMEPETKEQQFDADFLIMTETMSQVLNDLLNLFKAKEKSNILNIKNDISSEAIA
ncbi:MAG: recombination-associated protein RdgC, partial [Gammaproteobacteria bacterium]|nr:recombination-associated protein RdgC [Gammaproteobacteria bacterium]